MDLQVARVLEHILFMEAKLQIEPFGYQHVQIQTKLVQLKLVLIMDKYTYDTCIAWLSSCIVTWDDKVVKQKHVQIIVNKQHGYLNFKPIQMELLVNQLASVLLGQYKFLLLIAKLFRIIFIYTYVSDSYCTQSFMSILRITIFKHKTCTNLYKLCTSNSASNSCCEWRNYYYHEGFISYFTHLQCKK